MFGNIKSTPSESDLKPGVFSAAQIARALGFTRQAARQALRETQPEGRVMLGGIECPAWSVASMPMPMRERLLSVATKRGYRSADHLLSDPPKRWTPSLPLNEIASHHMEKASRTRSALRRAIASSLDPHAPHGEWKRLAAEDYRREFGVVTERHIYRILDRVFDRDAGEGRFDDVALYLDEKLSRATVGAAISRYPEETLILDQANTIQNPQSPTRTQIELLWCVICQCLDALIARDLTPKKARRSVVALLLCLSIRLAKNEAALRDLVKSKHERWIVGGRCLEAIQDNRAEKSGRHRRPKLSPEVRNKIVAHALINCGGRESQAWRELREAGELPADLMEAYISTPSRKSYVPNSIRRTITPEVNRLKPIHHGPREAQLRGAFHTRNYDEVPAGAWFQADDVTPPVYFYTRSDDGNLSLIRGQFLPMVCVRSAKVLGFVLIMDGQYDSLAIRELITRVCLVHGLPSRGFHFENGLWRTSKILTGSKSALQWDDADQGLRGLGMEIVHAKLPRGKVIENIIGILQNQTERVPGYCGRDERNDKFERLQKQLQLVRAGHEPVEKFFLSEDGAMEMFGRIIARYNAEPQEGRLKGLSPDQAWINFQSKEPRQGFDHRTAWILAHDVRKVRVTGNGITIRIGKRAFNYKSDETAARIGETVVARFNPAVPDILPFQGEGDDQIVFADLCPETPAYGAGDIFEENERRIKAHDALARRRYKVVANSLPTECFRVNLVDPQTAETARRIDARKRDTAKVRDVAAAFENTAARINMRVQSGTRVTQDQAEAARELESLLTQYNDQ